jgi:site-specific DNA recombinase
MHEGIRILLKLPIAEKDRSGTTRHIALARLIPLQLKRRGVETRMVLTGEATPSRVELPLLKAVARARRWALELISEQVNSVDEIARREQMDKRSVRRLLRLGFLSPRIIEAIAEGHQPPDLTVFSLMRRVDLPLLWNAQEQALGLR